MSETLTLPGTIPGLLRFGSPVRSATDPLRLGVVVGTGSSRGLLVWWCMAECAEWCPSEGGPVALDLSDATGRAHAAWWAGLNGMSLPPLSETDERLLVCASRNYYFNDDDIAALRRIVLDIAGVTP